MYAIGEYHEEEGELVLVRLWTRSTEHITLFHRFGDAQFVADRLSTSNRIMTYKVLELCERGVR